MNRSINFKRLFRIDKNRYKIIIKGIATNWKRKNNITDTNISIILKIFNLEANFSPSLIFNDNKGILTTKRNGRINAIEIKNLRSEKIINKFKC